MDQEKPKRDGMDPVLQQDAPNVPQPSRPPIIDKLIGDSKTLIWGADDESEPRGKHP